MSATYSVSPRMAMSSQSYASAPCNRDLAQERAGGVELEHPRAVPESLCVQNRPSSVRARPESSVTAGFSARPSS